MNRNDTSPQFELIRVGIKEGAITTMQEVIRVMGIVIAIDLLKIHHKTLTKKMYNPELFTFADAWRLADILGMEPEDIMKLISREMKKNKAVK
ncbi:hypothetical protein CLV59_1072 [Chitinophaga dinghuensis]|uniref:Cro/C1-type helix-turn-helix DNA-binding protein n=1 Tax=Chitinophaga dinghuensis TaxID=1539050 RepID=A0A327VS91_9BACT|nr:hypothetical protein [Chitinophaga dinghuensis]RAJ77237.1 hypothetical protein CLV59_1072 [Chitinophaga dinghuensis]